MRLGNLVGSQKLQQDDGEKGSRPEIIPPEAEAPQAGEVDFSDFNSLTLAQISNYTDRPDLLIETLETHDPGFVQRMNAESEEFARRNRDSMFNFGRFQAYAGTVLSIIAALVTLGLIAWVVATSVFTWQVGLFFIVFYAVTQGGSSGFAVVIESMKSLFGRANGDGSN